MPKCLTLDEKNRRANWSANCGTCGKLFGWAKNGDKAKYCCRVCAGSANGKIKTNFGKLNKYTCGTCKKEFFSYYKNRKYCCKPCFYTCWKEDIPMGIRMRKDNNHKAVVEALEGAGAAVLDMSMAGNGFPDLIVGMNKRFMLMEIKNPKTAYGRAGLNKNQEKFFAMFPGYPICLVDSPECALRHLRILQT